MLIFDHSEPGQGSTAQWPRLDETGPQIPEAFQRKSPVGLPEVSELTVVRHYSQLSRENFSIDTNFYPLGSCSMKYNPRGVHRIASLPDFLGRHPLARPAFSQATLSCLYDLQAFLQSITGFQAVSLSPMAGAQGELAGVMMIKSYHEARGDHERTEMLVPDAAHGTNPASAVMCGYTAREIPTDAEGNVDLTALKAAVGPQTAGIMLTNPSTLGVFEADIQEVAKTVHEAGGLLYYNGANLNAILGKVRPGDMGFDVMHMNLHKTFATPHGGGGPGAGPVAVNEKLVPYLPGPIVVKDADGYRYDTMPDSIGRLSAFQGNAGILLRAYLYIRLLGPKGLRGVGEVATLNANYLQAKLQAAGFELAYPTRRATHEFIITLRELGKTKDVTALDFAKRLLDHGIHAPTMYFPIFIPECLLIEPTETESKKTLDDFIAVCISILKEIQETPETVRAAPHTTRVARVDDVKAARQLDVVYEGA